MNKITNYFSLIIILILSQASLAYSSEEIPGEYLVKLKENFTARSLVSAFSQKNNKARLVSNESNILLVSRPIVELKSFAMESLLSHQEVEYVEPNRVIHLLAAPNDPELEKLWGLINESKNGDRGVDILAREAWELTTGSKDVIVAVIDTGVDYSHPDLQENMWVNKAEQQGSPGVDDDNNGFVDDIYGYNFADKSSDPMDDQGHGTHCSGTIGAKGNDGVGVVGVNWDVSIMALKFLDSEGAGTLEGAIGAIDYAIANGARVLSNSWGGYFESTALEEAVKRTNQANAIFIAAAGNERNNNDKRKKLNPASIQIDNVVSVAAVAKSGSMAWFSNFGEKFVHLGAPGVDIYSTKPNDSYGLSSGTSMATPHVSGVAALVLSRFPNLTNLELKEKLLNSTTPLTSLQGKTTTGGFLNAYEAVK
ncbi:MAG: S8 family serine peptidase [Bdellovibrionales bacterium]|nr:S8 family serine peptidase [Bdellovibrionales bacterium]